MKDSEFTDLKFGELRDFSYREKDAVKKYLESLMEINRVSLIAERAKLESLEKGFESYSWK